MARKHPAADRATLRRMLGLLAPVRGRVVSGSVAMVCAIGLQLAVAPLLHRLINEIDRATGTGHAPAFLWTAGAIFLTIAARAFCTYLQTYLLMGAVQRVALRLRERVFEQLLRLPHAFYDGRETGAVLSGITSDIPALQYRLYMLINESIGGPLMLVGGVLMVIWIDWKLALIAGLALPPVAWFVLRAGRRQRHYQARVQELQSQLGAEAGRIFAGVRTVKAFGAEAHESARFAIRSTAIEREIWRSSLARLSTAPIIEVIGALALALVMAFAGYQILRGDARFDFGSLAALILVLERLSNAARQAGHISMNLGQAAATAERLFAFLDQQPAIIDLPHARPLGRVKGEVEFDRVTFGYVAGLPVLQDLSFRISPGELVAVVGRSGMGKSTLLSLLPRFYEVTEGSLRIDGCDVREVTLASLRNNIAIVPQEVQLFSGTVADNLRYGSPSATQQELEAAAKAANAHGFIMGLPEEYDTEVGEGGARLSGGQRQRLAIARALLKDAPILLLDEATASLDSESEALVQEALGRLMAGRTTLVIAHRLSTIRHADRILVIDEGRVVETGTHGQLIERGGVYAALHATQHREPALAR